jgi:hypothetical protein
MGSESHGQRKPRDQRDGDAEAARDEGGAIPPSLGGEATEEWPDGDRAVVRRRIPRIGTAGCGRRCRVADQRERARRERRHTEAREPKDNRERKSALDEGQQQRGHDAHGHASQQERTAAPDVRGATERDRTDRRHRHVQAHDEPDPRRRGAMRAGIEGKDQGAHLSAGVVTECEQANENEDRDPGPLGNGLGNVRRQGKVPPWRHRRGTLQSQPPRRHEPVGPGADPHHSLAPLKVVPRPAVVKTSSAREDGQHERNTNDIRRRLPLPWWPIGRVTMT